MECKNNISFDECELSILRMAVDKIENVKGKKKLQNDTIQSIIQIVEDFIKSKKCICYGGTAINNILPKHDQFYNKNVEFPDYDFFSPNAFEHAKQLADLYFEKGFREVEAKAGMHEGTYKVYVNFIPVADITFLHKDLFDNIKKDSIKIDNILYAPANFLRMSMYLELSRPMGDVSRWEKVLKRIRLLNKHYPLKGNHCDKTNIQRIFDDKKVDSNNLFTSLRNIFISEQVVFFGAMAHKIYTRYMSKHIRNNLKKIPDFDVLSNHPEETTQIVVSKLKSQGFKDISIVKHKPIGELISSHYEIKIHDDTIAFVYKPIACHSYNVITINNKKTRIATIDTMLSFYLAFLYSGRDYYDVNRILCMCELLFTVQEKNRLSQKGVLRRFSIKCIGKQEDIQDIRAHKSLLYKTLKKNSKAYEKTFLRYTPKKKRNVTKKRKKNTISFFDKFFN